AGEPWPVGGDARRCGQRPGTPAGRLARCLRRVPGRKAFEDALDTRRSRNSPHRGSMDKLNPWERRYPAPAKLNLFLHVVGRRPDCATTIAVLNRLWGLALPEERLAAMALTLGADVPFFLFSANAFAEGVGERLARLELPPAWYVVLVPPVHVATQAIFAAPELTRNSKTIKISSFSAGFGRNDLESVVCRRHAEVAAHLEWLRRFGDARMSGSGACVFVEFATEREARAVLSRMPAEMRGFAVRGLDRHPLAALLEQV